MVKSVMLTSMLIWVVDKVLRAVLIIPYVNQPTVDPFIYLYRLEFPTWAVPVIVSYIFGPYLYPPKKKSIWVIGVALIIMILHTGFGLIVPLGTSLFRSHILSFSPIMLSIGETIKTFLLYTGLYVFLSTLGLVAKGVGTWGKVNFRNYRQ